MTTSVNVPPVSTEIRNAISGRFVFARPINYAHREAVAWRMKKTVPALCNALGGASSRNFLQD
jgi:hypothetical protein